MRLKFRNLSRDGIFDAKHCTEIAIDYLREDEIMYQNGEPEPVNFWEKAKEVNEKMNSARLVIKILFQNLKNL